jgi:GNAT superfamily N-acetyltransferase
VDRHSSVRCYLINIGKVLLRYGENPDARLDSRAALFFGDDLTITDPIGRAELIEGALLDAKRAIEECRALAEMASELVGRQPTLALIDGSLVLWGLSPRDYEGYIKDELLNRQYLGSFDIMKQVSKGGTFALAGYISFPRSADVVNALKVALCPSDVADCERNCSGKRQRECDAIAGVQDADIFDALLDRGQRSALFSSGSKFVRSHYGEHQVHFFYLKLEEEVVRIEIPQWVAEHNDLVDLVHSLVLDQCRRGHGYPVALMEAHEKAVVTAADREGFRLLVEQAMVEERVEVRSSGKSQSKRLRWV